jgi:hypothetical protein
MNMKDNINRNIKDLDLLLVLYGCETWSHTPREEQTVFGKKVRRRIFESKRDEVVEVWRRMHNEELHNLYTPQNIIRMMKSKMVRWVVHVACMGEMRHACNILIGKPKGKKPLGRPRYRWEDNSRVDVRENGWEGVGWIHLVQDRDQWWALVNVVMNLPIPKKVGNFLTR